MTILEQVIRRMEDKHFTVIKTKEVDHGWQVTFTGGRVVTVFSTGRVYVQGRWVVHTLGVLGIGPNHRGRLPEQARRVTK